MQRLTHVAPVRRLCGAWRRRRQTIAFVPTMGAIHPGHLSLVRLAQSRARRVVVSIFVNPLQFGPREDFRRYPRPIARDRARLRRAGVDLLWEPTLRDLYDEDDRTRVRVLELGEVLEGAARPGHFEGVATVVAKLLGVVAPEFLVLGQKDAQQARLIEQMARDLRLPVRVVRGPTMREPDGLACSSRNLYLSRRDRAQAVAVRRGLMAALRALRRGERSTARLKRVVRAVWRGYPRLREDYVEVVDADRLAPVPRVRRRVLVAVAARVGRVRLIDNLEWGPR
jgi:pantoate--beta-alanine ligase